MASSRTEGSRKAKAGDAVTNRQKQLEAFTQGPENQLTTSQGVVLPDNHNSLKAGLRGPTLLQDFLLREKLTHFDHERIPERVIYARGAAAHGYFELTRPLVEYTRADFLQEVAAARRCSCASPTSSAHRDLPIPCATCAASPSSSTRARATTTWWAAACRCFSSR